MNRVEGLFLGVAGVLDMRRAAPGVSVRAFGGWAFSERAPKGGVEAVRVAGPWVSSLRAERELASTNDFSQPLTPPGGNLVGTFFGTEDYDWVDRNVLALSLTRELSDTHSSSVRVEFAGANDHGFPHEFDKGIISGDFRPNRPVTEGHYVRSRAQLDFNRNILTSPLAAGVGATLSYERGDGSINWQRTQLQAFGQRILGRFVFAARNDAAIVGGASIPVQQLLEIGGAEGLPGYAYKAFTCDAAITSRGTIAFVLPVLEGPIHVQRLVLPAIAPQLQVGIFGGRATATRTTTALLDQLNWKTSDGWKGSFDVRLRFLAGALSLGASRSFENQAKWKVAFGLGGTP
ncbi:MAG: hypothetical protein ABJC26_03270 [Gemmatimonadaceae bacterium]